MISILIAHYNNGKYFEDCWKSLLLQTSKQWEAVIVDDCSTDNSLEIIKKVTAGDARAKIFVNPGNKGVAYTKHQCVLNAKHDLAGFLDPDDVLEPNAVEVMLCVFNSHSNIVLAYSKMIFVNEKLEVIGKANPRKVVDTEDPYFFNLEHLITHFNVFKVSVYNKTDGIDPYIKRAVDQDMYLRLCEKGPTLYVDEFLIRYRMHEGGISTGDKGNNTKKAYYWFWYVINSAAKRRGVYVEDLFIKHLVSAKLLKKDEAIISSLSYRIASKLSKVFSLFVKK